MLSPEKKEAKKNFVSSERCRIFAANLDTSFRKKMLSDGVLKFYNAGIF
jgi:hypothetical protein